jgi:hypothetical protein
MARDNRNAIIGFFTPESMMRPSRLGQRINRKKPVFGLRFLQTQNIHVAFLQEPGDKVYAQSDRIYVPGCQFHNVSTFLIFAANGRQTRSLAIRIRGNHA